MHLSAAAHEAGERHREIGPRTERLERWEVRRQPVDDELKETLWNREAPEPMFSQVSEGQAGRQLVGGKRPGCVGDEDLASMSDCGDPRGLVHIEAHICATGQATFSEISFAFRVTPAIVITAMIFAAWMGFLGGLLPALRAARMPITSALRAV